MEVPSNDFRRPLQNLQNRKSTDAFFGAIHQDEQLAAALDGAKPTEGNILKKVLTQPKSGQKGKSHRKAHVSTAPKLVLVESEDGLVIRENDLIADRYEAKRLIAEGTFCAAICCTDVLKRTDVCVKVSKSEDGYEEMQDEIKILRMLAAEDDYDPDSHSLLHVFSSFHTQDFKNLYLVTELAHENLHVLQKRSAEMGQTVFTQQTLKDIAAQILTAIEYFHSLDIIHCDIKPENIVVQSFHPITVKLIDFGSACLGEEAGTVDCDIGTPIYRTPELLVGMGLDFTVDIWAFACVLVELATDRVLFEGASTIDILSRIHRIVGPLPRQMLEHGVRKREISLDEESMIAFQTAPRIPLGSILGEQDRAGAFRDFVEDALRIIPADRPTAEDLLAHDWLMDQSPRDSNYEVEIAGDSFEFDSSFDSRDQSSIN